MRSVMNVVCSSYYSMFDLQSSIIAASLVMPNLPNHKSLARLTRHRHAQQCKATTYRCSSLSLADNNVPAAHVLSHPHDM